MKVIIESPYAGPIAKHLEYACRCMADSLSRGEAPFASHLLYTQKGLLDDNIPEEREKGINAGLLWGEAADKTVVYIDHGITAGMIRGIEHAHENGRPVEYRHLRTINQVSSNLNKSPQNPWKKLKT